ncbi:cytochrome c-type biogenesis protein CcmH [Oceanospirillum multiglobuliferum]|uniref:C-type cytochrome biogenesis protein CcmI n=1 Tax=Oceanospirillum multiglobuliferum TaxID=64969 RepID=A0A1T4L6I7_9GAMM|nr:c-type cytochrome biogenesis protein CcmI [Oceanospirillum multiglobuliferum]OPX56780.1 c-type cytochrome biogenesis protein CcmI [Oceanospirillum multiglobuliferum]SJZ50208.1 cytochrome c-type biogenesis protein CcmH [Oceanospirillum multiglobuliferum]
MTSLWIGIAALTAMAALFMLLPLLRKNNQNAELTEAERTEQNVAMYRQRLAELEAEKAQGNLLAEQFDQMQSELEQTLLDDVGDKDAPVLKATRPSWLLSICLIALVTIGSLGWYFQFGNSRHVELTMERQNGNMPSVDELVIRLEESLRDNPESVDGWYLLARTYMNMGRFAEAAQAMEKVIKLEGRTAVALAQYAQALYFSQNNQMTTKISNLLDEALGIDPNEAAALGLRGIAAFEASDYRTAIEFWQKALANIQDPNSASALRSGVAEAVRRLEAAGEKVEVAITGPRIKVRVSLSEALKAQAKPEDTVFVFARSPAGGPPMPLAAARFTVADLPVDITLDDSMAVAPMARLSSAQQVNLTARITKAGTPEPQAGDLQGMSGPYPVSHQEVVSIIITDVVQ